MFVINQIKKSARELASPYALCAVAMLLALRVVLGYFANATLPFFGNSVKISGAFLPIAVTGAMFGAVPAALVGALGDVLSFLLNPTGGAFFPGFTVSGFLTGMIYGIFLYKNNISLPRVIIAWAVNMLCVETFLAAFWLYFLYGASSGSSYPVYLGARFISQAVKCLPEIALIFAMGKLTAKIKIPRRVETR